MTSYVKVEEISPERFLKDLQNENGRRMTTQPPKPLTRKRRHSNDALKRSSIACDRCRGRKTKCAGTYPHPCAACVDAGRPCVYSDSEKRVSVPESYLHKLQARARRVDAQSRDTIESPHDDVSRDVDFGTFTGTDNWVPDGQGQYYFLGNSTSTYIVNRLKLTAETLTWHLYPHYDDASWLRRSVTAELPRLPPYEFAKRLYSAQRGYIGTIFSFLSDQEFDQRLKLVYARAPDLADQEECLVYCQVLLVFALGQMYSVNQWTENDGPPGFAYFKHALKFLPNIHEDSSILFVEVLSYVGYYMQTLNRRDAAYLYLGLAMRMAISLGLHQEATDQALGVHEQERRRRLWWSTYSLDRLLCVTSGHPISIQDDDIEVLPPGALEGESTRLPTVLRCYTSLSKILGRIGENIYRHKQKSRTSLAASVQTIMNSLSEWFRDLPAELRVNPADLDKEIKREGVSLYLYYYQCINMAARPLVLYVVRKRMAATAQQSSTTQWEYGLPADLVSVIHTAIAAARSSSSILRDAAKFNLVATYGFIDGEQAFSAALLLVMVNIAFPYKEMDACAMDTSLQVLQNMAERGNRYISACHSLLTKIRNIIKSRAPFVDARVAGNSNNYQQSGQVEYSPSQGTSPSDPAAAGISTTADPARLVNMEEDLGLWTEVLDSIDIDMDRHWIETALRADENLIDENNVA